MSNDTTKETKQEHKGWIGVDLDGTLAHYDGWKGPEHIGEPVPEMVRKVKLWLAEGKDVRIFTARVSKRLELDDRSSTEELREADRIEVMIGDWSEKHVGVRLPVTCSKDYGMIELYDDRCVYVFQNEGTTHKEHQGFMQSAFLDVATALGVTIRTGDNFKAVADACIPRARAAAIKADQYEKVLALLTTTADEINFALTVPHVPPQARADLETARRTFARALPVLRELAGNNKTCQPGT